MWHILLLSVFAGLLLNALSTYFHERAHKVNAEAYGITGEYKFNWKIFLGVGYFNFDEGQDKNFRNLSLNALEKIYLSGIAVDRKTITLLTIILTLVIVDAFRRSFTRHHVYLGITLLFPLLTRSLSFCCNRYIPHFCPKKENDYSQYLTALEIISE